MEEKTYLPQYTKDQLINLSYSLMRPYWFAQENIYRCYLPITPGEYGQYENKIAEIARRIFTHLWALPILIIGIPMLYIGNMMFLIVRLFCTSDYQYTITKANVKPLQTTCRIFHLNTCMLQGQLPVLFGGMTPATWRLEELTKLIKQVDADIVLLSEVNGCVAPGIISALKEEYPYFFYRGGANYVTHFSINPFGHDSNLFVASKIDLNGSAQFHSFIQQGYDQYRLITRGYFKLDFGAFVLFFTHLHPSKNNLDQTIRNTQMVELEHIMCREYKPTVLIGDLNIDYLHCKQEYIDSIEKLGYHPIGILPSDEKKTCTNAFNLFREQKPIVDQYEYDDYVLSVQELKAQGQIISTNIEPPSKGYSTSSLSDHDGLIVELELN